MRIILRSGKTVELTYHQIYEAIVCYNIFITSGEYPGILISDEGNSRSGNYNHSGRPGKVGGSAPNSGGDPNGYGYSKNLRKDTEGKPYRHHTLMLPPKEYAKIQSEISSNYGRYKGKSVCTCVSTDGKAQCSYNFENRRYGDYNIYGKEYDE